MNLIFGFPISDSIRIFLKILLYNETKRKPDAGLFSPDAGLFSPDAGVVVWETFVKDFVRLAGLADLPELACVNSKVAPRVQAELKARLARLLKEEREALWWRGHVAEQG